MKQFDLFNKNKQKVSIILADNAFDYNASDNEAAETTCLLKLATHFFRRSFLKPETKKEDNSDYTLQIYLKGLYSVGDDYNNIRIYYCWRLVKDNVVITTSEPKIAKIPNLNSVRDIAECRPAPFVKSFSPELKPEDITLFKGKFLNEHDKRWMKRIADISSTAPIPEDDIKFAPFDDNNAKKNILIAIYNAAREYYRALWDEGEESRTKNREKFNVEFAGFASINEGFQLSAIEDTLPQEKLALIGLNPGESFELQVDTLLQRCAGNRYKGEAYRCLAYHLNQLNDQADYFGKIEPVYGDVANFVPLVPLALDVITAPTNFAGITNKRKDFEFKPRISGRVAPAAPPKPPKVTNPFEPNFEHISEPPSPSPERNEDTHLIHSDLPHNQTHRRRHKKSSTAQVNAATNPTPLHLRPSVQITRVARTKPRFPDQTQRKATETTTRNQSFGARHPIWKKVFIGAAIGLAVAIVLAVAIGFIMFPPGAAAAAAAVAATATSKAGLFAAILAGDLIVCVLTGAGIGAAVGASAESKKQKRIAASIKEQERSPADKTKTAATPKRRREITRFASKKTREDIPLEPVKPLASELETPNANTPQPARTTSLPQPITAQPTQTVIPPAESKQISPPALQPKQNASLANLKKVGGYIPVIGGFIDPPQPIPTIQDFKNYLLIHYGAQTYKIDYELIAGTKKSNNEQIISKIDQAQKAIATWRDNAGAFKFIFSKPMVEATAAIKAAYIAVLADPAFEKFDIEKLNYDDTKFIYESIQYIKMQMGDKEVSYRH